MIGFAKGTVNPPIPVVVVPPKFPIWAIIVIVVVGVLIIAGVVVFCVIKKRREGAEHNKLYYTKLGDNTKAPVPTHEKR